MPAVAPAPADTVSIRSQSQEHLFRKTLSHLRAAAPDNPRQALLAHLSSLLPQSVVAADPILRAQRDAVQAAITAHPANDPSLYAVASTAMDAFLSVRVHGARAKTSAFFDRLCRDRSWSHVALLAPSTVAHACFLALNDPRKRLTVIDVAPRYPGRATAASLAAQTAAPTRYAVLAAAASALDGVDVLVIGAREVCINGSAVCESGAGALVQIAREAGVAVVVATQTVKFSERMLVDWAAGGDVVRPQEIAAFVTEMDTATWSPSSAPDILRRMPSL